MIFLGFDINNNAIVFGADNCELNIEGKILIGKWPVAALFWADSNPYY